MRTSAFRGTSVKFSTSRPAVREGRCFIEARFRIFCFIVRSSSTTATTSGKITFVQPNERYMIIRASLLHKTPALTNNLLLMLKHPTDENISASMYSLYRIGSIYSRFCYAFITNNLQLPVMLPYVI